MTKYMLVSFKTCPWVQRSAIILREKNAPFEFRHIEPDNRPDWFLAISPHKKVPTLTIDDKVTLFESNAINEYLDETIAPRLHPEDPIQRAEDLGQAQVVLLDCAARARSSETLARRDRQQGPRRE